MFITERLDVIIFGATGFTGRNCVGYAVNMFNDLKWGIAGRSEKKLFAVLDGLEPVVKRSLQMVPYLVADVTIDINLEAMMKRTKVGFKCMLMQNVFDL